MTDKCPDCFGDHIDGVTHAEPNGPRAYVCHPEHTEAVAPVLGIPGRRAGREPDLDGMPVFVLKGKDALAPSVIDHYRRECRRHGLHDQAEQVALAFAEMAGWQADHPERVKLPDHPHVPADQPAESPVAASTASSPSESPEPARTAILAGGAGIPDAAVDAFVGGMEPTDSGVTERVRAEPQVYEGVRAGLAAALPILNPCGGLPDVDGGRCGCYLAGLNDAQEAERG